MEFLEVHNYLKQFYNDFNIQQVSGRGNSLILKCTNGSESYLIKHYPIDKSWDRQKVEKNTYQCFKKMGIKNIPELKWVDEKNQVTCFEYIEKNKNKISINSVQKSIDNFILSIYTNSDLSLATNDAKEAFFSQKELLEQIQKRVQFLISLNINTLSEHILTIEKLIKKVESFDIEKEILRKKIISPSDFGPHNLIYSVSGQVIFFDFEYGGWDSLYKLLCDFYWHEGFNWTKNQRLNIINKYLIKNDETETFKKINFLMGIKWSLLVLNEFNPEVFAKRSKARGKECNYNDLKGQQLEKSKNILLQLKKFNK